MEDVIILILTAAVMIGGAVSSILKKKKEKEAAERKVRQGASVEEPAPERKFVRKSLSEVLEELANQQKQERGQASWEPEATETPDDYYAYETASQEENERAAERLRAMTYVSAENTPRRIAAPEPIVLLEEREDSQGALKEILGGGFDLRRAVIETEILKPKFEQY